MFIYGGYDSDSFSCDDLIQFDFGKEIKKNLKFRNIKMDKDINKNFTTCSFSSSLSCQF